MIFITGATSGIGRALALQCAAEFKMPLFLVARRSNKLFDLKQEIEQRFSVEVFTETLDLQDSNALLSFFKKQERVLSRIKILVNNAGLAVGRDPLECLSLADVDRMIDTNVRALIKVTQLSLPWLIQSAPSHIINIGSVAGYYTYPSGNVYNATKYAVRGFSEALRWDLLGKSVRVTEIVPGMVETEFSVVRFRGDEQKAKAVYEGMRALQAEDVAAMVIIVLKQPIHVNIQQLVVYPTEQAHPLEVYRKTVTH